MSLYQQIARQVSGMNPEATLVLGPGESREWIKEKLLGAGARLSGQSVWGISDLLCAVIDISSDQILKTSVQRQEWIRFLFHKLKGRGGFPRLKELARKKRFWTKADRVLQRGRMAYANAAELEVLEERLKSQKALSQEWDEWKTLIEVYENYLEANHLYDLPRLYSEATRSLIANSESQEWIGRLAPQLLYFSRENESRASAFWDELTRQVSCQNLTIEIQSHEKAQIPSMNWYRWHSIDDAALALADTIDASFRETSRYPIVWVEDDFSVRRSLIRALELKKIPLLDWRDPAELRLDEQAKIEILPLQVVASRFRVESVQAWMNHCWGKDRPDRREILEALAATGAKESLGNYRGNSVLRPLVQELEALDARWRKKTTLRDLVLLLESEMTVTRTAWFEFLKDWEKMGDPDLKAPLSYWLDRWSERWSEAKPSPAPVRTSDGIRILRLGQSLPPGLTEPEKPEFGWVFAMNAHYLDQSSHADAWLTSKDRGLLELDFQVEGPQAEFNNRKNWVQNLPWQVAQLSWVDADYDADGSERSGLHTLWTELGWHLNDIPCGGYGARLKAYGPSLLELPVLPDLGRTDSIPQTTLGVSELDRLSRCPFMALAVDRWKLADLRTAEYELWPDARGAILHRAVELWVKREAMTLEEALERAISSLSMKGIFQSSRARAFAKKSLLAVLENFAEKENEYRARSQTKVLSVEAKELYECEIQGVTLRGRPDRVDEHPDGLFVIDYKTGSGLPTGSDMVEAGYRLQLPAYALLVQSKFKRPVIGVQFVELNRTGTRSKGVFFKRWNGKNSGCLTQTTARKSLFDAEPQAIWDQVKSRIAEKIELKNRLQFPARPVFEDECPTCPEKNLCGFSRRKEVVE